jgi:hypothetical protein
VQYFDFVEFRGLFNDWMRAQKVIFVDDEGSFIKKGSNCITLSFLNAKKSEYLIVEGIFLILNIIRNSFNE